MTEEIIYVVDEKDQFVRKATRKEVMEKALLHRDSRVIIENSRGELLVHKRSINKDNYPGYWDIGIAETVKEGEGYVWAAFRGLREELGIVGISNIQIIRSFLFKIRFSSPQLNELCKVYKLIYDGKITMQKEEIDEVKFLPIEEVKKLIEETNFHPVGKVVVERYLEMKNSTRSLKDFL